MVNWANYAELLRAMSHNELHREINCAARNVERTGVSSSILEEDRIRLNMAKDEHDRRMCHA
jgi:hypothetical protein